MSIKLFFTVVVVVVVVVVEDQLTVCLYVSDSQYNDSNDLSDATHMVIQRGTERNWRMILMISKWQYSQNVLTHSVIISWSN